MQAEVDASAPDTTGRSEEITFVFSGVDSET